MGPRALAPVLSCALMLAVAGCGQQSSTQRRQVARYVAQVNRIESALAAPLMRVTKVTAQVSSSRRQALSGTALALRERQLAIALAQIQAQEQRLRALATPPQAARLRSLLLSLTTDEAGLTTQLRLLIGFLPRFTSVVAPLAPALARLERALSVRQAAGTAAVAAVYAAKVTALRRFEATIRVIVTELWRLSVPDVSKPAYRAQLTSLRGMGSSAGRLAAALAGGAPGNVRPLLIDFDRAALATRTQGVQKAQIAAIRAYDAQSRRLSTLSSAIARERLRLATSLH
jgi:hypothetical protein